MEALPRTLPRLAPRGHRFHPVARLLHGRSCSVYIYLPLVPDLNSLESLQKACKKRHAKTGFLDAPVRVEVSKLCVVATTRS